MRQLLTIPVYNEESTVEAVTHEALAHLDDSLNTILLINDGSTDDSPRILDDLAARHPAVHVLHHPRNLGYGASMIDALRRGREGGFDFVITMDCDRQHRPEDLRRFVTHDPAVDVVSGSRYTSDSDRSGHAPEDRVAINARITRLINQAYGWALTDSFCGFKRYKCSSIQPEVFQESGYAFPMEFWAYGAIQRLSIVEIPVNRIYTTDDRSFGEDLDRKRKRYRYYLETWRRARRRFAQKSIMRDSP